MAGAARGEAGLRRQLQSSQEARERRSEVLESRACCGELEQQLEAAGGSLPGRCEAREDRRSLEKALLRLEEEQRRRRKLAKANAVLQEKLNKAREVNSALKEDVGKLTANWLRAREELEWKERKWCSEREFYNNHIRDEQNHLLSLWRQVLTFIHRFLEMKTATDRDLSELKAEQMRILGSVFVHCSCLNRAAQLWEPLALGRHVLKEEAQQQVGEERSQKAQELMSLEVKEDLEEEELQDSLEDVGALEGQRSLLQSELVVAREGLGELHLQKDLLHQEKHKLSMVVEKAEQLVTELTETQNRLNGEIADLHAAKANLRSINEALALDEVQLNKLLLRVSRQQELSSHGLEELRQEPSRQAHALARVSMEKELVRQEKAALEVPLAATERDRQGLSEQLAEARSGRESLESVLFEVQQHLFQLETGRSQLEVQLHAVRQAKDVLQGEVKCLQSPQQTDRKEELNKLQQDLAREREELQEMLEKLEKEKAEKEDEEDEHEEKLLNMKQKVAVMQAQQEEERARVEKAKQEVLLEQESEKNVLLQTLLQTQAELREACQQLEQLRQEVKEQQESGQNVTEKLQAELRESQSQIKAVEDRHKQEMKAIKEDMHVLLQQRDALQNKVEELTSRLAASKEAQQVASRKAQRDLYEAQELSRLKTLEVVHLQKILEEKRSRCEEVEHQNKELRARLQSLEEQRSQWEEARCLSVELQASLKAFESERLTQSLEEKELNLGALENNLAQREEVFWLLSAIEQAQRQHSNNRREIEELNEQAPSDLVTQKELLQSLEGASVSASSSGISESRAGERCLRDAVRALEDGQQVASLERELESAEKQRKDVTAPAEREQLSWLLEKRVLTQQLECLQRTVTRLEDEKTELKHHNAELRRTLEQVEHERRTLKRYFRQQSLPHASRFSVSNSEQQKMPPSRQTQVVQEQKLKQGCTER